MSENEKWNAELTEACKRALRVKEFYPLFDTVHELRVNKLKNAIARSLHNNFGISFAPYSDFSAIPVDTLLPYAHQQLDQLYSTDNDKRVFLETIGHKLGYSFDPKHDDYDAVAHRVLDAVVNSIIIEQLIDVLRLNAESSTSLTPVRLDAHLLADFKSHYDKKRGALAEAYANAIEEAILRVSADETKPVYFISIGGAEGNLDKAVCDTLHERMPGREIHVVNIDPNCSAEDFVIKSGGTLINDVAIEDIDILAKRIDQIVPQNALRVLGCARALHHTSLSLGAFDQLSKVLKSDAVLLLEHPIEEKYRQSLPDKTIRLMNELVANFAFYGTSWLHSSDVFRVQFFQDNELKHHCNFSKEGVPGTNVYTTLYHLQKNAVSSSVLAR